MWISKNTRTLTMIEITGKFNPLYLRALLTAHLKDWWDWLKFRPLFFKLKYRSFKNMTKLYILVYRCVFWSRWWNRYFKGKLKCFFVYIYVHIYFLFWWKPLELLQCKLYFCICYVCRAVGRVKMKPGKESSSGAHTKHEATWLLAIIHDIQLF